MDCQCNDMKDFTSSSDSVDWPGGLDGENPEYNKKIEFTGNSMIMDPVRWYSRAALVFWPRSHRAGVLAKVHDGRSSY